MLHDLAFFYDRTFFKTQKIDLPCCENETYSVRLRCYSRDDGTDKSQLLYLQSDEHGPVNYGRQMINIDLQYAAIMNE